MEACFKLLNPYYKNTDESDFDFRNDVDGMMERIIGCIVLKYSVLEHTEIYAHFNGRTYKKRSFVS